MTEREYLNAFRMFRDLRISKDEWYNMDDDKRQSIINLLREVNEYSQNYKQKKIQSELDPYDEEDWDN
jgi:predicted Fe-S protein YdhL (DUF1289 family)